MPRAIRLFTQEQLDNARKLEKFEKCPKCNELWIVQTIDASPDTLHYIECNTEDFKFFVGMNGKYLRGEKPLQDVKKKKKEETADLSLL